MTAPHRPSRPAPRYLTVAEVAGLMRVSDMTIYRLIDKGDIRAIRVGRSFRIPVEAVREFVHGAETVERPDGAA